jgi:hypothetical protein
MGVSVSGWRWSKMGLVVRNGRCGGDWMEWANRWCICQGERRGRDVMDEYRSEGHSLEWVSAATQHLYLNSSSPEWHLLTDGAQHLLHQYRSTCPQQVTDQFNHSKPVPRNSNSSVFAPTRGSRFDFYIFVFVCSFLHIWSKVAFGLLHVF